MLDFIYDNCQLQFDAICGGLSEEVLSNWAGDYLGEIFFCAARMKKFLSQIKSIGKQLYPGERRRWASDCLDKDQIELWLAEQQRDEPEASKQVDAKLAVELRNRLKEPMIGLLRLLRRRELFLWRAGASSHDLALIDQRLQRVVMVTCERLLSGDVDRFDAVSDAVDSTLRTALGCFGGTTVAWRVRLFAQANQALAQLIWDSEHFRRTFVASYLKVPSRQQRRYMDTSFDDLLPLVDGRLEKTRDHTDDDDDDDDGNRLELHRLIAQDKQLKQLYRNYRRAWDTEQQELIYNQIIECRRQLVVKFRANKQKQAKRGPINPNWYL